MTSLTLIALANHLWQSTLFAVAVACLTLLLRTNAARVRYCLWLAASAKFLVPFALLTAIGALIPWPLNQVHETEPAFLSFTGQMAAHITQFGGQGPTVQARGAVTSSPGNIVPIAVAVLWVLGTLAVAGRWLTRWSLVRRALRESTPSSVSFVIPVRASSSQLEPAVVGVMHPVLLIPHGMEQSLTSEEMRAILAHERCHVMWSDNLAAASHMLVEALFWFHPLTWWLGTRLIAERERACDEQVLAEGHPPESYAEGILKICEQYLQSHLACAAGISGANLRCRIEAIVRNDLVVRLGAAQKLLVSLAAGATLAVPIAIGALTSPQARAQAETSASDAPVFRNVSIQIVAPRVDPGPTKRPCLGAELRSDGRVTIGCPWLRRFIAEFYGVSESQVVGMDWSKVPNYEVTADDPGTPAVWRKVPAMTRNLFAKQFGLVVKRERRQMDGYVLSIGPAGSKLKSYRGPSWKVGTWAELDEGIFATGSPVAELKGILQGMFKLPVVDQTGLRGDYEYVVRWKPSLPGVSPTPTTVAKALEEQLGLRLEAKRVTADIINVIGLKSPAKIIAHDLAAQATPPSTASTSANDGANPLTGVTSLAASRGTPVTLTHLSIQVAPPGEASVAGACVLFGEPGSVPDGRMRIGCPSLNLRRCIADLYGVFESQVVGRDWSKEPNYDITADDPPGSGAHSLGAEPSELPMIRNLLVKQFGLVVRREQMQTDGYVLTISSSGSKLTSYSGPSWKAATWMSPSEGAFATGSTIGQLTNFLQRMFKTPVVDQTALRGHYEYVARWKPSSPGASTAPAAIAKALEDQLGLHLEPKRVTVEMIDVIGLKSAAEVVTHN